MSNRLRTAASHPHELHEVHDVQCGWEVFGKVGRFKGGKTWFYATLITHDGKPYPAWDKAKHACRASAEQACFNRWLRRHDIDVEGRANARSQASIDKANQAALDAENASAADALRNASAEELADALSDVLDGCNGRIYGDAFEHVKEKLEKHIGDLYIEEARPQIEKECAASIEETLEDEKIEYVRFALEPVLRAMGAAAYGQISDSERGDLRDFLCRQYDAYNANAARFL